MVFDIVLGIGQIVLLTLILFIKLIILFLILFEGVINYNFKKWSFIIVFGNNKIIKHHGSNKIINQFYKDHYFVIFREYDGEIRTRKTIFKFYKL